MEIREMKKEDWHKVAEIYQAGMDTNLATYEGNIPTFEQFDQGHFDVCRYVAVIDNEIVGWVVLQPISSRNCFKGVAEVSVYVDTNVQAKGIGKTLLKYLVEKSEEQEFWMLQSGIMSNNHVSIHLHESCGFRLVGERERIARDQFGEWRSMVLMERRSKLAKFD